MPAVSSALPGRPEACSWMAGQTLSREGERLGSWSEGSLRCYLAAEA